MRQLIDMTLIFVTMVSSILLAKSPQVDIIQIQGGTINPVSAEYIISAIDVAEEAESICLILELDTPGGLISATQEIVKRMLAAKIPLVVFIYPSGSGAVSAGTSITIAAHIAVMAPGTNIGAAHPVSAGKTDTSDVGIKKATNWWATFNRTIAEKRGRNAAWLEKAVRESESITEKEALEKNVIDFICPTVDSLLILLDSKTAQVDTGKVILHTKNAEIILHKMNFRSKILDIISNPSVAYILLMLGLLGMYFEFSNPGAILPGVLGGIFLILAFFALQQLPFRVAGVLLILLAILLFLLEIKIISYGLLTVGGMVSMLLGSLILFKSTPSVAAHLPFHLIISVTIASSLFFIFAILMAIRTHHKKISTGKEGMKDEIGIAISDIAPDGQVKIHGEYWTATSTEKINKNEKIRVLAVEGLQLIVEKFQK